MTLGTRRYIQVVDTSIKIDFNQLVVRASKDVGRFQQIGALLQCAHYIVRCRSIGTNKLQASELIEEGKFLCRLDLFDKATITDAVTYAM